MSARVIGGYRLEEALGRGAVATVFATADGGRPLAVKLLNPTRAARQPLSRERFLRESRAAIRLVHPHVVRVVEHGEADDGTLFLVMERVDGPTLAERVAEGPLPLDLAVELAAQLADALAYAHEKGIVHRDLKPANVLLAAPRHAKLADFGLARDRLDLPLTATGALCGTPAYMAPELVDGGGASPASDAYALGCVLFEMLTGRWPFIGSTPHVLRGHAYEPAPPPSSLRPAVPPALDTLVVDLLAKDASARPSLPDVAARLRATKVPPRSPERAGALEAWRARVLEARSRVAARPPSDALREALDRLEARLRELESAMADSVDLPRSDRTVVLARTEHKLAQIALADRRLTTLLET